jgi:hypothetical protein
MDKNTKVNIVLSKQAQEEHIPGTIWSKDNPQIQMKWKQFEDLVGKVENNLEKQCERYKKALDKLKVSVENRRTHDEFYDETLDYINQRLQEADEGLNPIFYDLFHAVLELNAQYERTQPKRTMKPRRQ